MKILPAISLLLSVVAVVLASLSYFRADAAAGAALERREAELIETINPKLQEIYADFDMTLPEKQKNPKTLEDALGPLMQLTGDVN